MDIYGIGTDICEIARIKSSLTNERFLLKYFSEDEQAFLKQKKNPQNSTAANFAAKEAFAKALGTGVRGFSMSEVSVLRDNMGMPYFKLSGKAKEIVDSNNLVFKVTLSHSDDYAVAFVIAMKIIGE